MKCTSQNGRYGILHTTMKITGKYVLDAFVARHADTQAPVNKWVRQIENNTFRNHNALKRVFPSADYVGNGRYVFNIKGNRYRIIVVIVFADHYFRIKFCGTHSEYTKIRDIKHI